MKNSLDILYDLSLATLAPKENNHFVSQCFNNINRVQSSLARFTSWEISAFLQQVPVLYQN